MMYFVLGQTFGAIDAPEVLWLGILIVGLIQRPQKIKGLKKTPNQKKVFGDKVQSSTTDILSTINKRLSFLSLCQLSSLISSDPLLVDSFIRKWFSKQLENLSWPTEMTTTSTKSWKPSVSRSSTYPIIVIHSHNPLVSIRWRCHPRKAPKKPHPAPRRWVFSWWWPVQSDRIGWRNPRTLSALRFGCRPRGDHHRWT